VSKLLGAPVRKAVSHLLESHTAVSIPLETVVLHAQSYILMAVDLGKITLIAVLALLDRLAAFIW
jgi:hypothetical protein